MAWTDPKTWSTNDILSASDLNTYLRDNERAIAKLTSYTPTWTASTTNPVIGNGILHGRYVALEEWCQVWIAIVPGSTTTFGSGSYSLALPFATASVIMSTFQVFFFNSGVSYHTGMGVANPSATTLIVVNPSDWGTAPAATFWNPTSPFTFGNGDFAIVSGSYRRV